MVKSDYKCVVKRKVSASRAAPRSRALRLKLLEKYGAGAFAVPSGTPASEGVPSFPVVNESGCFVCSLGKAAYIRMGQGINRRGYPRAYRERLKRERKRLIRTALQFADEGQKFNACNWALAAARRYL
jgi:hypothetical protein